MGLESERCSAPRDRGCLLQLSWGWVTLHCTSCCGIHFNGEKEERLGGKALVQPEFPLSFLVDPLEEVGIEGEKHVPVSRRINCLDWIVPQGNTAEGSRRGGEGFSCDSLLGAFTQPLLERVPEEAESLGCFHRSHRTPRKLELF